MKDNKTALYAMAFILIGGLLASPSMQIGGIAFAQDDTDEVEAEDSDYTKDSDDYKDYDSYEDHREKADRYCEMSQEEQDDMLADDEMMREHKAKLDEYCQLDEADKEQYIRDRMAEMRDMKKDYMKDKMMDTYEEHREWADRYCSMTEEEQEAHLAEHEDMREHKAKLDEYCQLDEADKEQYIRDRMAEMRDMKKDKMMDNMGRDFVRDFNMRIAGMCDMSDQAKRQLMAKFEFLQEHHERIAEYCNMSAEEREKYRMDHQDMMEDFREDMPKMHDKMMDGQNDMRMKMMHDKMRDYDMSDERRDAIQEKFRMKYSDKSDVQRDEIQGKIKSKYMQHFTSDLKMRHDAMSNLQKDQILQRIAEMKDYKTDLRLKYQDMSEDERVQFQAEFRDKVSDKRFSWISPHKQMLAGVPVDELECREGLNLVLKSSNGKAMCVKSATAESLIEKGLAVPAA